MISAFGVIHKYVSAQEIDNEIATIKRTAGPFRRGQLKLESLRNNSRNRKRAKSGLPPRTLGQSEIAVHKSQFAAGVYKPITKVPKKYVDTLSMRLKGGTVYHGGNKRRIGRIRQGKKVYSANETGAGGKGIFTTPRKGYAEHYGVAGRTRKLARKNDGPDFQDLKERGKGRVAAFETKGKMPKEVNDQMNGQGLELVYNQKTLGKPKSITGIKPGRTTRRRGSSISADKINSRREWFRSNRTTALAEKHGIDTAAGKPYTGIDNTARSKILVASEKTSTEQSKAARKRFFSRDH